MKFALIGLIALSGMAWAAPDLNDDFASLKEAVAGNDGAKIKSLAPQVSKDSRAIVAKGDESADVLEFAKGANDYADYALAVAAVKAGDPKTTVELGDILLAQNPKSIYVDTMAGTYLAALGPKSGAGAQKILAGRPENEDALYYAMAANPANAGKLVAVMSKKTKPEGMSDAAWTSKKDAYLGAGYFYGGASACGAQRWAECERSMKAAEGLVKGGQLGSAYFYIGLAEYQLGTLTQDRTKIQAALKYSQQAAAIPGPNQGQASQNVAAMQKQLGGAGKR